MLANCYQVVGVGTVNTTKFNFISPENLPWVTALMLKLLVQSKAVPRVLPSSPGGQSSLSHNPTLCPAKSHPVAITTH